MKSYVLMICAAIGLFILSEPSSAQNKVVPNGGTTGDGNAVDRTLFYATNNASNTNSAINASTKTIDDNSFAIQSGITAGPATGFVFSCQGTASVSPHIEQIQVSGTGLAANLTVIAPGGFEVSTAAAGVYGNSLVLSESSGTLSNTTIYVRSAATAPAGRISGKVIFSSPGAGDQTVTVTGLIVPLIAVDPVANQTVKAGTATTAINFTGTAGAYSWANNTPGIGLAAGGTGNIPAFTAVNNGNGPITATITATPLPQAFAFVSNFNKDINVLNILTGQLAGSILVGRQPESVAISQDGRQVYICDLNSEDIAVVDGTTFTVSGSVPTGSGSAPDYVALSPDGSTLYAACAGLNTILVISTATNSVITSVPVGYHPSCITVSPDGGTLYVTNQDSESISIVNAKNYGINTISLGYAPYATAISPDGSTLYIAIYGTDSRVLVMDTSTGNITATIPVAVSAQSIAITPDGTKLYVTNSNANTVTVISTATNQIITTIGVDNGPFGVAVSPDGSLVCVTNGSGNDVSVINTATDQVLRTIHAASAISLGDFVAGNAGGCVGPSVTFTITVNPAIPPSFTATADLQGLTTTYGTPSSSESFTISGANLTGDVLITPPPGFEISTDGASFSGTVSVSTNGSFSSKPVYIRLAAASPVGTYSGDITLSTPGIATVSLTMPNSTVDRAPLKIIANDQTKSEGAPNPELTISYSGFVNGENQDQLTALPVAATNATKSSTPGSYVITVDGAQSSNYTFIYVNGTLTILPSLLFARIPNAFTPNGDGINDFWNIPQLAYFPNCLVSIYTRYGDLVFQSRGYGTPWDGTSKGSPVPTGTYYYVIDPRQQAIKPVTGYVAVLR